MKHHTLFVIFEKRQNLKLSSAVNFRRHFKVTVPSVFETFLSLYRSVRNRLLIRVDLPNPVSPEKI